MGKEEYEEEEQAPRKRKKKGHQIYAFFVLIFGAAILILLVLILFYVQKVEVTGNEYCSDQEIIDMVQSDKYSINTLYILSKYALGYGNERPCFEKMKVSLKTPWTLKVSVKEKPIIGYVLSEDKYAYFDKEGMVVMISTDFREGLPSIEGIEMKNVKLFKKIKSSDDKIFEEILETSREVKKYGLSMDRMVCKDDAIYLYMGTVRINLGNKVSSEQIAQIGPIMNKLQGQEGTLHLENHTEGNTTITFTKEAISEEN